MKAPPRPRALIEEDLIDSVVRCSDETRCAPIYRSANKRSFRQAVDYTENRKFKNSHQIRAKSAGTKCGREAQEAA